MTIQLILCAVLTILFDLLFESFLIGGLYYIFTKGELYIKERIYLIALIIINIQVGLMSINLLIRIISKYSREKQYSNVFVIKSLCVFISFSFSIFLLINLFNSENNSPTLITILFILPLLGFIDTLIEFIWIKLYNKTLLSEPLVIHSDASTRNSSFA